MPSLVEGLRSTELDRRMSALDSQLRLLLGSPLRSDVACALFDELAELPVSVVDACADRFVDPAHAVALIDTAIDVQGEVRDAVLAAHASTFGQINDAFASLAEVATPADLVERVPALLCEVCDFDRAMISRVRGSTWMPAALHVAVAADDEVNVALVAAIRRLEIPLTSSLIETEILRRRSSLLVDGTAVSRHPSRLVSELSRSRAYVAAPIVIADRVAGFLHADAYSSRRALTYADRVALQAFADMFGLLYERVAMAEQLLQQQQAISAALSSAVRSVGELGPQVGQLRRDEFHESDAAAHAESRRAENGRGAGTLTSREWEILGLLATGATNGQIAAALVVSESTVKSHVKRILRKLPAANRAEAVYRYTQMTGERSRVS